MLTVCCVNTQCRSKANQRIGRASSLPPDMLSSVGYMCCLEYFRRLIVRLLNYRPCISAPRYMLLSCHTITPFSFTELGPSIYIITRSSSMLKISRAFYSHAAWSQIVRSCLTTVWHVSFRLILHARFLELCSTDSPAPRYTSQSPQIHALNTESCHYAVRTRCRVRERVPACPRSTTCHKVFILFQGKILAFIFHRCA